MVQASRLLNVNGRLEACTTSIEWYNPRMIRLREIHDPDLKQRIVHALAERRGCSVAGIPDWFELDDADYVDLLNDLKEAESPREDGDWRM